jgi:transposase
MEVIHRRCSGLDVHKETVVACMRLVLDGKITREVRTFETTTSGLLLLLAWLTELGCTHVAMEATGVYWKPVWNILSDGDFELVLANAAHVKNVPSRKTDVSDAAWIADLLAHGLIRSSFVPEQMLWGRRRDNAVKSSLRSTPIDGAPLCRSPTTRAKHPSPPLFRIAHLPW